MGVDCYRNLRVRVGGPENKTRVNHGIWIFYESITQAVRVGDLR